MRKGRESGERFHTLDNYTERNIYLVYHNKHKCGQLEILIAVERTRDARVSILEKDLQSLSESRCMQLSSVQLLPWK